MKDCTICVGKTKGLISFASTAKLICIFVFAYANGRLSHDAAVPCFSVNYFRHGYTFVFSQMKINVTQIAKSLPRIKGQ